MPPANRTGAGLRGGFDRLAWIALAWAVGFGLLYAEMIARTRAPGLVAAVRRAVGP